MPEEKDRIWEEIKRRASEEVKFGIISLTLKVQDGKIVLATISRDEIKIV